MWEQTHGSGKWKSNGVKGVINSDGQIQIMIWFKSWLNHTVYSPPSEFVAVFSTGSNPLSRTVHRLFTSPEVSRPCQTFYAASHKAVYYRPLLFLLYCADVTNIAERHGVTAHSYADDTQLYVHCTAGQCATEAIVDWRPALKNYMDGVQPSTIELG